MGLKEVALTFGIAVLFALFVGFTIDAVYSAPDYQKFCPNENYNYAKAMPTFAQPPVNCTDVYVTEFAQNCSKENGDLRTSFDSNGCTKIDSCDFCRASFDDANKKYNLHLLWITAVIGIIAIIAGMYAPLYADSIASGAIFGGVLVLMYGTIRAFTDLSKIARAVILALELGLLIWLGVRKVLVLPKQDAKKAKVVKAAKKKK